MGADRPIERQRENVSDRNHARYMSRHGDYQQAVRRLERARELLEDLHDRARRAGVPPGSLR